MKRESVEALGGRELTEEELDELFPLPVRPMANAMTVASEIGRGMATTFARELKQPEFRAGLGASLLTTAMLARTRLPFFMVCAISVMVGAAVEDLYGMAADIHEKLTADAPGEV